MIMKAILEQKNHSSDDQSAVEAKNYVVKRTSLDVILYEHFVWCAKSYIKEFQTFYQFWQQQITSHVDFGDRHVCQ